MTQVQVEYCWLQPFKRSGWQPTSTNYKEWLDSLGQFHLAGLLRYGLIRCSSTSCCWSEQLIGLIGFSTIILVSLSYQDKIIEIKWFCPHDKLTNVAPFLPWGVKSGTPLPCRCAPWISAGFLITHVCQNYFSDSLSIPGPNWTVNGLVWVYLTYLGRRTSCPWPGSSCCSPRRLFCHQLPGWPASHRWRAAGFPPLEPPGNVRLVMWSPDGQTVDKILLLNSNFNCYYCTHFRWRKKSHNHKKGLEPFLMWTALMLYLF